MSTHKKTVTTIDIRDIKTIRFQCLCHINAWLAIETHSASIKIYASLSGISDFLSFFLRIVDDPNKSAIYNISECNEFRRNLVVSERIWQFSCQIALESVVYKLSVAMGSMAVAKIVGLSTPLLILSLLCPIALSIFVDIIVYTYLTAGWKKAGDISVAEYADYDLRQHKVLYRKATLMGSLIYFGAFLTAIMM